VSSNNGFSRTSRLSIHPYLLHLDLGTPYRSLKNSHSCPPNSKLSPKEVVKWKAETTEHQSNGLLNY
jgi:hypothetical protein